MLNEFRAVQSGAIGILIADDHELIRVGIGKIVRGQSDMEIVGEAADVASLLALLKQKKPSVLILDLNLPPFDNLDALKTVVQHAPSTPIIILSMYPEERFAVRALKNGAAGYITKAMAAEELVVAIRKVVLGGSYINPKVADLMAAELRHEDRSRPASALTSRELQVATLIAAGLASKQFTLKCAARSQLTRRARFMYA